MNQPTPAKMAREMLKVDRRARRRQNRTRIAHRVHAIPRIIRPEHLERPLPAPTPRALTPGLDMFLAAILWLTAAACVAFTIALALAVLFRA